MSEPLKLIPSPSNTEQVQASLLTMARELLASIERGEVRSLVLVAQDQDLDWEMTHSSTLGFPEAIGRLEIAKQAWILAFLSKGDT